MSEEKEIYLKPCPFCGNKQDDFAGMTEGAFSTCSDGSLSINCSGCSCTGARGYTMEEAVEAWNNRAPGHKFELQDPENRFFIVTYCCSIGFGEKPFITQGGNYVNRHEFKKMIEDETNIEGANIINIIELSRREFSQYIMLDGQDGLEVE